MDVLEHTVTRLTLQDRTVLSYWRVACLYTLGTAVVFGILAGPFTLFGAIGIKQVLTHERKATLTCYGATSPEQKRPEISPETCQLVRFRLIGRNVITIPLSDLQSAVLQSGSRYLNRQAGNVSYYWVELNTKNGPIRLTEDDLDEREQQVAIATQINAFIKTPNELLQIEQKGRGLEWVLIILFVPLSLMPILFPLCLMSILSLYLLRSTRCTFDKTLGTLTVEHQALKLKGIEFFSNILIQHSLEEITAVQVDAFKGNAKFWNLVVVLNTGQRISLIWMPTPGKEEKQVMAHRIRQFLDR